MKRSTSVLLELVPFVLWAAAFSLGMLGIGGEITVAVLTGAAVLVLAISVVAFSCAGDDGESK